MIGLRLLLLSCLAVAGCDACEPDPPGERSAGRPEEGGSVRAIFAGGDLRCLLHDGGRLRCDGAGAEAPSGLDDVTHVALHAARGCAVLRDGAVSCWEGDGEPERVTGTGQARAVAVGARHACALAAEGEVRCWGENRRGQIGDGTTEDRGEPVTVPGLAGVTQIAAGDAHTCALLGDGRVRCWGGHARVEDVAREPRTPEEIAELMPQPVVAPRAVPSVEGVERIAAGPAGTCAVTSEQRVLCWPGYLGGRSGASALAWPEDAVHVAAGEWGKCAVRSGGAVACWDFAAAGGSGRQVAPVAVRGVDEAREVAVGRDGACAREEGARVLCWSSPEAVTVLGSGRDSR